MSLSDNRPHTPVISVKEWLFISLMLTIPVINIVMALVWLFNRKTNPSKANYIKAVLLFWLLWTFVVGIVLATRTPA